VAHESGNFVKSPFSHNALFGFTKLLYPDSPSSDLRESCSELQSYSAFAGTPMPERLDDLLERLTEADSFAWRRGNFAESPADRMDAFSQILTGVKLNGAVFFTAEFSAPWGFDARVEYGGGQTGPGRSTSSLPLVIEAGPSSS